MTANGTDQTDRRVFRLARMRKLDLLALAFEREDAPAATGTHDKLLGAMTHDQLVTYLVRAGRDL